MNTANYTRLTIHERINLKSWYYLLKMPMSHALRVLEDDAWKTVITPQSWYTKFPARCVLHLHATKKDKTNL